LAASITFVVSNAIYIEFERGDEWSDERVLSSFCAEKFVCLGFEGAWVWVKALKNSCGNCSENIGKLNT
jgi:hypothetical protein